MLTVPDSSPGGISVLVPEAMATAAGLTAGAPAEVVLSGGRLIVRPADAANSSGPATLIELLAGITPENRHGEWAPGPPVGRELL